MTRNGSPERVLNHICLCIVRSHPVIREPSNEDKQLKIVYKQVDTLILVFVNTDNAKCISRIPSQIRLEYNI